MKRIGESMNIGNVFAVLGTSTKTCDKHGIEYVERVYKTHTIGCPECRKEADAELERKEAEEAAQARSEGIAKRIADRIGDSGIPARFQDKTLKGYQVEAGNDMQQYVSDRMKTYAREFSLEEKSIRNIALLGNAGTGKTHLACAIGSHVIKNCGGVARFVSVSELNRIVRESKSYQSAHTESEVIAAFGAYDLLIIDEVGVQSGTDAESRALFDVFNERYQNLKPTILISNLDPAGFRDAVGERIADRIKEDGGEVLLFNWESGRG